MTQRERGRGGVAQQPFSVRVYGNPAPQGSKKLVGPWRMVEDNKNTMPWRQAVQWFANSAAPNEPLEGPLEAVITFYLPRPKSATKRDYPHVRPDLDKLTRATWDALKLVGVYRDDGQIVLATLRKHYADADKPGASILIVPMLDGTAAV